MFQGKEYKSYPTFNIHFRKYAVPVTVYGLGAHAHFVCNFLIGYFRTSQT